MATQQVTLTENKRKPLSIFNCISEKVCNVFGQKTYFVTEFYAAYARLQASRGGFNKAKTLAFFYWRENAFG